MFRKKALLDVPRANVLIIAVAIVQCGTIVWGSYPSIIDKYLGLSNNKPLKVKFEIIRQNISVACIG